VGQEPRWQLKPQALVPSQLVLLPSLHQAVVAFARASLGISAAPYPAVDRDLDHVLEYRLGGQAPQRSKGPEPSHLRLAPSLLLQGSRHRYHH